MINLKDIILKTANAYNHIGTKYDSQYVDKLSLKENDLVFNFIKKKVGKRVLDLGCGTGLFLEHINPKFYIGVDISRSMLRVANRNFGHIPSVRFGFADMHNLKFLDDNQVDTVVCLFGTGSHSPKLQVLMEEIDRVLVPGGNVFLMTLSNNYEFNQRHIFYNTDLKVPIYTYSKDTLYDIGKIYFKNIEFRGLNIISDKIPRVFDKIRGFVLAFEWYFLSKRLVNKSRHIIFYGEKRF